MFASAVKSQTFAVPWKSQESRFPVNLPNCFHQMRSSQGGNKSWEKKISFPLVFWLSPFLALQNNNSRSFLTGKENILYKPWFLSPALILDPNKIPFTPLLILSCFFFLFSSFFFLRGLWKPKVFKSQRNESLVRNFNPFNEMRTENQRWRTKEKFHLFTAHWMDSSDVYNIKIDCNVEGSSNWLLWREYIYT